MTRALLVCAAAQPGGTELVREIATAYDVVIGVDAGAALCLSAGVTPTLIVGDCDSIDTAFLDEAVDLGVSIHSYPPEKDRTDLDLAIGEARVLGVTEIAVTAATAKRLDHTLGVLAALASAVDLAPRIVEPDLNGWILAPEGLQELVLHGVGATVSVVPFSPQITVSMRGVRWPLEHADILYTDTVGISNVICSADAFVGVEAGVACVLSPRTDVPPAHETNPSNG